MRKLHAAIIIAVFASWVVIERMSDAGWFWIPMGIALVGGAAVIVVVFREMLKDI